MRWKLLRHKQIGEKKPKRRSSSFIPLKMLSRQIGLSFEFGASNAESFMALNL